MPTLEHDGAVLAYDDTAEPDLPSVVLLAGVTNARTTWSRVHDALAGRVRLVRIDHRGHGESSHVPGTYDLDHYGPDAIAVVDHVLERPAVFVGHSLGGVVSHYVADRRPDLVRGVFMEDPPLYYGEPGAAAASIFPGVFTVMRDAYRRYRGRGATLEEYVALVARAPAMNGHGTMGDVLGDAALRAAAAGYAALDPEVLTPAIEATALAAARPDRPLACPVRVLRADPALGAAFTAEHDARFLATNPHAAVTMVGGASHLVHDEQPDRFLAELVEFLDSLDG